MPGGGPPLSSDCYSGRLSDGVQVILAPEPTAESVLAIDPAVRFPRLVTSGPVVRGDQYVLVLNVSKAVSPQRFVGDQPRCGAIEAADLEMRVPAGAGRDQRALEPGSLLRQRP